MLNVVINLKKRLNNTTKLERNTTKKPNPSRRTMIKKMILSKEKMMKLKV